MKKKINIGTILGIIGIIIVLVIGFNVRGKSTGILFDNKVMDFIHSNNTEAGIKGMKIFTNLGSKYFFILALIALFFYFINRRERRNARLVVSSVVISYGINAFLKIIFNRVRPLDYMLISESGFSFPSGHSMVSMSFYTTMTYIILERVHNKGIRSIFWILNFILIFFIGYSRLYLGVHWPTDVISGFIMGFVVFYFSKEIIRD